MSNSGDTYLTIAKPSEGLYKEKGSKFIAYAHKVYSDEEVKDILNKIKKDHPQARHVCYAYRLGIDGENYRYNDDGEPSGTAGKPIYGQLLSFNVTNVLIAVVRYFGGTKLGVGGLITAYKEAAKNALESAEIIEETAKRKLTFTFHYGKMSDVMNFLKRNDLEFTQDFSEIPKITVHIRLSDYKRIKQELININTIELIDNQ
jgi:uncharacterized YigZ family protein